ncbi:MAG: hypothetical protein ACK40G_14310 [Cytophagaceae bacterium]
MKRLGVVLAIGILMFSCTTRQDPGIDSSTRNRAEEAGAIRRLGNDTLLNMESGAGLSSGLYAADTLMYNLDKAN